MFYQGQPAIGYINIKRFLLRLSINIIAILIAVTLVPGIELEGPWWGLGVVAAILGLINTSIRPLLTLLTLPFVILSFGLFILVINAIMLYFASWLAEPFGITFSISGLGSAVLGALIINMIAGLLLILSGDSRVQFQVVRHRQGE
jgi:putative membrane protein